MGEFKSEAHSTLVFSFNNLQLPGWGVWCKVSKVPLPPPPPGYCNYLRFMSIFQ